MIVRTRREAMLAGDDTYFTGRLCPQGHIALRRVSGACCECARLLKIGYVKRNPEKVRAWKAADQKKHRTTANERALRWYHANAGQAKAATATWQRNHRDKTNAKSARRRAAELRCTPSWANAQKIARAYEIAAEYRARGIDAHVDHIVPLQGETVCGLHVHDNLQILTGIANRSKSNHMKGN